MYDIYSRLRTNKSPEIKKANWLFYLGYFSHNSAEVMSNIVSSHGSGSSGGMKFLFFFSFLSIAKTLPSGLSFPKGVGFIIGLLFFPVSGYGIWSPLDNRRFGVSGVDGKLKIILYNPISA